MRLVDFLDKGASVHPIDAPCLTMAGQARSYADVQRLSWSVGRAHCIIHGNCNYKQTGLLQAYAAYSLLQQPPRRAGFASGCQAFGHRELLGVLRSFGLVMEPALTRSS